ncbi:unnamed protein product [Bursaphelenchus xylophilus]|nr:unnamed protein product [Bursaphelenchus xylophilus]CAG9111833.1 unnamed protein product [Bursaphelenchus xylophilus]
MSESPHNSSSYPLVPPPQQPLIDLSCGKSEHIQRPVHNKNPMAIRFRGVDYEYPAKTCGISALTWIRFLALLNVAISLAGVLAIWNPFLIVSVLLSIVSSIYFFIVTLFKKSFIRYENLAFINYGNIPFSGFLLGIEFHQYRTGWALIPALAHIIGYSIVCDGACYLETGYWCLSRRSPVCLSSDPPVDRTFFFWHELGSRKIYGNRCECRRILGYVCSYLALTLVFANILLFPIYLHNHSNFAPIIMTFWYLVGVFCFYERKAFLGYKKEGYIRVMVWTFGFNFGIILSIVIKKLKDKYYDGYYYLPRTFGLILISTVVSGILAYLHSKFYKTLTERNHQQEHYVAVPSENHQSGINI